MPTSYDEWIDSTPPEYLYHYTSVHGFFKICESVNFRATQINYLNDSSEYTDAQELFMDELNKIKTENIEKSVSELIDQLKSQYKQGNPILNDQQVYVISFSEKCDDLSQWRAYCQNGGIHLGMDSNELKRIANIQTKNEPKFKLVRCEYNENKKRNIINEFITSFINNHLSRKELLNRIAQISCAFKHEKFEPEAEWRLVHANIEWETEQETDETRRSHSTVSIHKHMKFYTRDDMLIPYIEFSLNPEVDNTELHEDLDLLESKANDMLLNIMKQQEENVGANQDDVMKSSNLDAEYRSLYSQIGDRTRLPKPLRGILIGPGGYDSKLLKSSIYNYIQTKINVLRQGCRRDKLGGEDERYAMDAFWGDLASRTGISKIPYRQKL